MIKISKAELTRSILTTKFKIQYPNQVYKSTSIFSDAFFGHKKNTLSKENVFDVG